MNEYRDLQILGVGKEPGGRFGRVLIAGSGKITGDVECQEFSVPGAGKVEEGGLTVHGPLSCHGACKVEQDVRAESLSVHGAFSTEGACEIRGDAEVTGSLKSDGPCTVAGNMRVTGSVKSEGDLRAGRLQVSGVLKSEASIRAEEITVTGVLKADGDVQAERFTAEGPVTIEGELNAEQVELRLSGESQIGSIGGARVQVRRSGSGSGSGSDSDRVRIHLDLNLPFFGKRRIDYDGKSRSCLICQLIEADEIWLENTDAETVRGVNVHIGSECVVDRGEYSGSLTTAADASVGEKIKI